MEKMSKPWKNKPIYITFDKYNVWYRAKGEERNEEIYNLEDALAEADFLNVFVRNSHIVKMINMKQLINMVAPIYTSKRGYFMKLFSILSCSSLLIVAAQRLMLLSIVLNMNQTVKQCFT